MSPPSNSLLRPFYIFTYLSLAVSVVIFILSMLDLGFDSFLTNPCVSALTIIYHIVIVILHRHASKSRESTPGSTPSLFPTSKIASLVFAYILASAWLVAISMTVIAGLGFAYDSSAGNPRTAMAQLVLCVVEFLLMCTIAGLSTRMRVTYDRWAKNRPVFNPVSPPSARSMSSLLSAFYILTYTSLGSLTLLFTLSMLDLGFASYWTNPSTAGVTIVYHVVILVLQRRESRLQARALNNVPLQFRSHPTAKIASLVFAYVLACAWSVPTAFTLIGGGIFPDYSANYWSASLYAGNYRTVIVQLALDVIELHLLFAIAAVSTRIRVVLEQWEKSQRAIIFLPSIPPTTPGDNDNDNDDDKWSLNGSVKASSLKHTTIA